MILAALLLSFAFSQRPFLHMPSVDTYAKHDPYGTTILPEGRLLTPAGTATALARWPYGLVVSPTQNLAFVASDKVGQWISNWDFKTPDVAKFEVGGNGGRANAGQAVFSSDGTKLYWSSGETGAVYVYDVAGRKLDQTISLDAQTGGQKFEDSYCSDLALSGDGKYLYCADYANCRLAVVDIAKGAVVSSTPVGRYPYSVAVHGSRVFVANIGQFEYSDVTKIEQGAFDPRGLTFPPYGYPSKEAEGGVEMEGRHVPGLGSPFAPEAFSVYGVDVSDPLHPAIVTKTKTGAQIGSSRFWGRVVGGSGPCCVLASSRSVYVSNSNDDTVDELDPASGRIRGTISLEPSPLVRGLQGVEPTGMALSQDERRLFLAEAGLNAVAVIDTDKRKVLGLIPTAWYPYRLGLSSDGKTLCCICFKGFGNGPKGSANPPTDPFLGMKGSFHSIPVPTDAELPAMTATVLQDMGIVDASKDREAMASPVWSLDPGQPSKQIKYVVFITKENHTFDTIFDRVPGSSNDPSLLRWGLDQTVSAPNQPTLEHVGVMVNHNKLAREFTVSDNFYMEPEASGVGHRWLVDVQPNNWCQMLYTLGWDFKNDTTAPGRRTSFGGNSSLTPEDYPEAGSMWHHLARHGISFRNYGEGFEFAGGPEDAKMENTGIREVINMPMPKVLFDNTCRDFPNFNLNIPDAYRAELFEKDFSQRLKAGIPFPQFLNIAICCDHGTDPNPAICYKYKASYMADNDGALGEIVQFLSRTPYWKNMAIFVTEDDAGGENDHIDAQRSVLLIISPYAKRGYVSHRHTTITSMHRTMYEIFGMPPMNLFDAISNDFSDCFTAKPDYTPYTLQPIDKRLFDYATARNPKDPDYRIARTLPTVKQDDWDDH